ncbi:MAG TPA: hypothetical protein DCZ61_07450, partial [Lachnospiraceae bacterium]|nr:hypothetical protein [Lachnospiraceae bacterium]
MRKKSSFKRVLAVTLASVMTFSQSGVATIAEETAYVSNTDTDNTAVANAGTEETAPAQVKSTEDTENTAELSQNADSGNTDESASPDAKPADAEETAGQKEEDTGSGDESAVSADDAYDEESDDADDEKSDGTDEAQNTDDSKTGDDAVDETSEEGEPTVTETPEEEKAEDAEEESSDEEDKKDESEGTEDEESEDKDNKEEGAEEAASYKVTFITDEHIHVFVDEEEIKEGLALAKNGTLSFTTAADEGYIVAGVLVNKQEAPEPVDGVYTINGIEDDKTVVSITAEEEEPEYYAGELSFPGSDYIVKMNITEAAKIPADAKLAVREIMEGTSEYEQLFNDANRALKNNADEKAVTRARFFDIQILATVKAEDGTEKIDEVEPKAPV